jgi:hypothetical protein
MGAVRYTTSASGRAKARLALTCAGSALYRAGSEVSVDKRFRFELFVALQVAGFQQIPCRRNRQGWSTPSRRRGY